MALPKLMLRQGAGDRSQACCLSTSLSGTGVSPPALRGSSRLGGRGSLGISLEQIESSAHRGNLALSSSETCQCLLPRIKNKKGLLCKTSTQEKGMEWKVFEVMCLLHILKLGIMQKDASPACPVLSEGSESSLYDMSSPLIQ